jgi:hypothetical protein
LLIGFETKWFLVVITTKIIVTHIRMYMYYALCNMRAHVINCQARLRFNRIRAILALLNHLLRLCYLLDS